MPICIKENPVITVACATYNQVDYIANALDGFVHQNIDVPYEIVIHDDASDDGTVDVIKKYADKYPKLINPILQKENQYSKGKDIIMENILPHAKGKYIAICEGDDYWCNPDKLSIQCSFLQNNPEYSLCIHNCLILNYQFNLAYLSEACKNDKDKYMNLIISEGAGIINPTASFFFKKNEIDYVPTAPVRDYYYLLVLASKGKVRWLNTPMSIYRSYAKSSWSVRQTSKKLSEKKLIRDNLIKAIKEMDAITNEKYHEAFLDRIKFQNYIYLRDCSNISHIKDDNGEGVWSFGQAIKNSIPNSVYNKYKHEKVKIHMKYLGKHVCNDISVLPEWALPLC